MNAPKKHLPALLLLLLLVAAPAHAEEENGNFVSLGVSHVGEADVEDNQGGYSVTSVGLAGRFAFLSAGYELSSYSWNDKNSVPFANGGSPWDTLHSLTLGADYGDTISGDWSYFVYGGVNSAFEKEMDDSFGATLLGGISYDLGEGWKAKAGLGGHTHQVRNTLFPVLGLSWHGTSSGGLDRYVEIGLLNAEAGYAFTKSLMLRAAWDSKGDFYRLADDSDVHEEGYADISDTNLGLYLDWKAIENFKFTFGAEYRFDREITIYDSNGDKLDKYDIDSAPAATVSVDWLF